MSNYLLVYLVKTKLSRFTKFRVSSLFVDNTKQPLPSTLHIFVCNVNPKLSWHESVSISSDTWIPVSDQAASGFVYTSTLLTRNSTSVLRLQCSDDHGSAEAESEFSVICSYDFDQGVVCAPISEHGAISPDELYLYYIFAHGYNPPSVETPPPLAIRLTPVKLPASTQVTERTVNVYWPPETPILVGHGGAGMKRAFFGPGRQWPDNTVCAFQRAEQLGLPMVECDATVTRDHRAVLLHHNFTVRFLASVAESQNPDPYEQVFSLEHLPDAPVDEHTTNMVINYSLSELRNLFGRTSCPLDEDERPGNGATPITATHPKPLGPSDPLPDTTDVGGCPLPELADALRHTSTKLGFNVEFKYPRETLLGKIFDAAQSKRPIDTNLAGPHSYFSNINKFCDKILNTLWKHAGPRPIVLSCFNADLCAVLKLKQSHFPVLFITRGGIASNDGPSDMMRVDLRHSNLDVAISWAHMMHLDGIVTVGKHFGSEPSVYPVSQEESMRHSKLMAEHHLACFVYGLGVSVCSFFDQAAQYGLTGVIIDRVDGYVDEILSSKSHTI